MFIISLLRESALEWFICRRRYILVLFAVKGEFFLWVSGCSAINNCLAICVQEAVVLCQKSQVMFFAKPKLRFQVCFALDHEFRT